MIVRRLKLEALEGRLLLAADFGDAPAPYDTLLVDNGASHETVGPMLGATRDTEADGLPTLNADGDGADDDGVAFSTIRAGQLDASVVVNVQNAPAGARLDTWFDFNCDGSWGGAWEQITANLVVVEGDNLLMFDVPSDAKSGSTYARFRLSTTGNLGPGGQALDGEVEDYLVTILPPAAADGVFSTHPPISSTATAARDVTTADLEGDGDMDVISAAYSDSIDWYENQGDGQFVSHNVTMTADGANAVKSVDLDRDGDMYLLAALPSARTIVWYENDGSQIFAAHTLNSNPLNYAEEVHAADMDSDGDLDIVAFGGQISGSTPGNVVWFENLGGEDFSEMITITQTKNTMAIAVGDVNQDGHIDVVATARDTFPKLALLINDGDGNFTQSILSAPVPNVADVIIADIDGDGDGDIVFTASGPLVVSLENDGQGNFPLWNIIDGSVSITRVVPADVDGDGHIDLVAASYVSSRAYWYRNDGAADPTFSRVDIAPTAKSPWGIATGDLDGDGDLDVVTPAYMGNRIEWFESIPANLGDFDVDGDVDGRDFLAWQRGYGTPNPVPGDGDADHDGDVEADDLANWQATYGYVSSEPLVPMFAGETAADVTATDQVLAEGVDSSPARDFVPLSVSTAQVSRPKTLVTQPATIELVHDRVFAELGTPSKSSVREFGDIAVRRLQKRQRAI